jgi:hypothetical protein
MPEPSLLRIGDRVTMEGSKDVFFVVDANRETQTVSLLPSGDGKILDKIAWATLKSYHGPKVN